MERWLYLTIGITIWVVVITLVIYSNLYVLNLNTSAWFKFILFTVLNWQAYLNIKDMVDMER